MRPPCSGHMAGFVTTERLSRGSSKQSGAQLVANHRTLPGRISIRRRVGPIDIVIGFAVIALLYGVARLGESLSVSVTPGPRRQRFRPGSATSRTTRPARFCACSSRSALSTLFTFVYGTAAARLRRAEMMLIPTLDILQSVPILGFLTFTTVFFLHLFGNVRRARGSVHLRRLHLAGLEHDVQLLPLAHHPAARPRSRRLGCTG